MPQSTSDIKLLIQSGQLAEARSSINQARTAGIDPKQAMEFAILDAEITKAENKAAATEEKSGKEQLTETFDALDKIFKHPDTKFYDENGNAVAANDPKALVFSLPAEQAKNYQDNIKALLNKAKEAGLPVKTTSENGQEFNSIAIPEEWAKVYDGRIRNIITAGPEKFAELLEFVSKKIANGEEIKWKVAVSGATANPSISTKDFIANCKREQEQFLKEITKTAAEEKKETAESPEENKMAKTCGGKSK